MPLRDFLLGEVRFSALQRQYPELAEDLFSKIEKDAQERIALYKKLAQ